MKVRWFRFLVGLFPAPFRDEHGVEMLEALNDGGATGMETWSLAVALAGSWNRHLRTRSGVRAGAAVGAALWFGLLLGVGPVLRGMSAFADAARWQSRIGSLTPTWMVWAGAGLILVSMFAVMRSRVLAAALFLPGLAVSALANSAGEWSFRRSLFYEAFWIGLAAVAALWLGKEKIRWVQAVAALLVASVSGLMLFSIGSYRTTYGYALSQQVPDAAFGSHVVNQGVIVLAIAVVVGLGPWFSPAVAGVFLPAVTHLAITQPVPGVVVVAYLIAIIWLRVVYVPRRTRLRQA